MRQGPYEVEELVRQQLAPDTLVWTTGMPDWVEACQVPELHGAVTGGAVDVETSRNVPPEVPENHGRENFCEAPAAPVRQTFPPSSPESSNFTEEFPAHKRSRGWMWGVAILVILLVLLFTRPGRQSHVEAISEGCVQYSRETIDNSLVGKIPLVSDATKWFFDKLVAGYIDHHLAVNDFFFFNVGKMEVNDRMKTVSVGILDHVFTFDKEDIAKAVERYLQVQAQEEKATGYNAFDEALNQVQKVVEQVVSTATPDSATVSRDIDSVASKVTDAVTRKVKEKWGDAIDGIADEIEKHLGTN